MSAPLREPFLPAKPAAAGSRISPRLWLHVVVICVSGLVLGYDLCVIASILTPVQRDLELCDCRGDGSDAALARCTCAAKQLTVSACHIGAMIGGSCGGLLSDAIGRRSALVVTDVGFVVGAAAMALAPPGAYVALFFVGRAIAGLALGAAGAIASTFIVEIAPAASRGMLVTVRRQPQASNPQRMPNRTPRRVPFCTCSCVL